MLSRLYSIAYVWHNQRVTWSHQLWPFTSYNWLFLWDYTFYKWGFLFVLITAISGHNWCSIAYVWYLQRVMVPFFIRLWQLMVALSFLPMLGGVLSYLTLIIWAATWIGSSPRRAEKRDGWCRSLIPTVGAKNGKYGFSDPGKISMFFFSKKKTWVWAYEISWEVSSICLEVDITNQRIFHQENRENLSKLGS